MTLIRTTLFIFVSALFVISCSHDDEANPVAGAKFNTLVDLTLDGQPIRYTYSGVSLAPQIVVTFSEPLDHQSAQDFIVLQKSGNRVALTYTFSNGDSTVAVKPIASLDHFSGYSLDILEALTSSTHKTLDGGIKIKIVTAIDGSDKFERIADDELLDLVQKQTLKYFYDFAHPQSGMARERNSSGNTVTTGGSGFGIMAVIAGMERNFITRQQGVDHLNKMVTFLEKADRFHGAWSHWIDGTTGKVIPFSTKDNGGDLVETSFLVQGLITFRQYLKPADTVGNNLIKRITKIWEGVEWDWYRQEDQKNVLYWHWSPNYTWDMNFAMYGYFEEQVTYFLAAASPTHSIPRVVYANGYGQNGAIVKNDTYYGYKLPVGGLGPLFWTQYSYLGLDPHFKDDYADYWQQNVNASLIDQAYCIANPKHYAGYGESCWGLTASDNPDGYNAHSPANDLGVITPTAALSAFAYTPQESMKALKFFYYTLGDKLWGPYGFYDAFSLEEAWVADSYLAIDQGPIVAMIENYRSGLLWELFMSAPEVQAGVDKLGFVYSE
jgi:hypothetical protein